MELTQKNFVDKAENVMRKICREDNRKIVTTSKIRKILSMVSDIYNDVRRESDDQLSDEILGRVQYLKMHIAYEAGREKSVETLVREAKLFEAIDEIGESREQLILFCHYMEALVAYRKYLGGKDE